MSAKQYTLMQHQKDGVAFLESVDGIGALLWDPGVGKTLATLSYIDGLAAKQGDVRVLVVAPLAAVDTWVLQPPMIMKSMTKARMLQGSTASMLVKLAAARDWASVPDAPIHSDHVGAKLNQRVTILSMSSGAISSFCTDTPNRAKMLRAIRKFKPDVIVVDESHTIKSATANISKAMALFSPIAKHRIILTGTVTPLGPLDVYGQWRFLAPWTFSDSYTDPIVKKPLLMTLAEWAAIRPWPWGRFKDRYTIPGGYKGKGISDYVNQKDLNDRVAERSHVVRKEDALDLPPVTDVAVHVTLTTKERAAYKSMAEDLLAEMEDGTMVEVVNALGKIMKLRQIASGFVKDTETGEVHVIGSSLRKAVKEVVEVTLAGENRIVVFAYFRRECELLEEALRKKGVRVEVITGSTKPRDRLAIRQRFADVSGNPQRTILIAQQRTMSMAVNELVTAQHAIYASMSEQRADFVQSRGRLDRNGQQGDSVTFWNVFTPGLIGEIMLDRHRDNGNLEKALLDHVRDVATSR